MNIFIHWLGYNLMVKSTTRGLHYDKQWTVTTQIGILLETDLTISSMHTTYSISFFVCLDLLSDMYCLWINHFIMCHVPLFIRYKALQRLPRIQELGTIRILILMSSYFLEISCQLFLSEKGLYPVQSFKFLKIWLALLCWYSIISIKRAYAFINFRRFCRPTRALLKTPR